MSYTPEDKAAIRQGAQGQLAYYTERLRRYQGDDFASRTARNDLLQRIGNIRSLLEREGIDQPDSRFPITSQSGKGWLRGAEQNKKSRLT